MTDATSITSGRSASAGSAQQIDGDSVRTDSAITNMLTAPAGEAPDRRALVAYSAWLDQERRFLCHEMYPHLGWKAASFVVGSNAGFEFHRGGILPASTRAEAVLALAGCDWSGDGFLGVGEDDRAKNNLVPQSDHFPHPDARLMDLERAFHARRVEADEAASAHKLAYENFKKDEVAFVELERDLVMHEPMRAGLPPLYWTATGVRRILMGGSYGGSARDFEVVAATPRAKLEAMLPRLEARESRQAVLSARLDLSALGDDADWATGEQTKAADAIYNCSAHTLDGLMIKARVLRADQPGLWKRPSFFDGPGAEPHELALTEIADGVEHLLSVRGLPGGSTVHDEGLPNSVFADVTAITGGMHHDDGTVTYTDAAGKVHRRPVSDWIAFTAMRMVSKARTEMARQIFEPTLNDDARAQLTLKLRADLRVDALHTLAFRSREAFDAGQAEQGRLVYGEIPTRKVYLGDEVSPGLKAAIEAHREARQMALHDPVEDDMCRAVTKPSTGASAGC